jgi:hypothetical protein
VDGGVAAGATAGGCELVVVAADGTLIWVAEDIDLLWLRRCELLKAVNLRVLVSWL